MVLDAVIPETPLPASTDQAERDAHFAPGNDYIWGEGNWIRCAICPLDSAGFEVYHHKDHHG